VPKILHLKGEQGPGTWTKILDKGTISMKWGALMVLK
jgi:hypothetical protein